MRTPASIFKHPIHTMLVVFTIGLWIFSLACDLIRLAGASGDAWFTVAFFSIIGALCAAVLGFIDLLFYKGAPPLKKVALIHMVCVSGLPLCTASGNAHGRALMA